ncbi:MAG: DUF1570 domain-containing protein [Phycisphaeraceae bacterium]
MSKHQTFICALCTALAFAAQSQADSLPRLTSFASTHYDIHTNVAMDKAREIGRHMDAVFEEYTKRFHAFGKGATPRMPLYLLKTQQEYLDFMRGKGVDATGTGGIFFIRPDAKGLATWLDNRPSWITLETLQHEGFHQFAYACIGTKLPLWVNEGMAEYFGDAILVDKRLRVGICPNRRLQSVKQAVIDRKTIDFDELLTTQPGKWHQTLVRSPERGRLQYDQSWSMVYFLIHGEDGRYRAAFEKYLTVVAKGMESGEAFKHAFGAKDTVAFRRQWEKFAATVEPDAIDTAVGRMRFLAQGIQLLHERRETPPSSLEDLRKKLAAIGFRAVRIENGVRTEVSASDASLYVFNRDNGSSATFELVKSSETGVPPGVRATGLQPQPTLIWTRDDKGELLAEVDFR